MKRKLAFIIVFCCLFCSLGFSSNAVLVDNEISTQTSSISQYQTIVLSSGETRIIDSDGLVVNQIIVNVDQIIDIDLYKEKNDFFGIEITAIKPLFNDEWVEAIIKKIGYKFSYLITIPDNSDIEAAMKTLENNEHISAVSQNAVYLEPEDSLYDNITAETGHYDLIGVDYAWEHGFVGSDDVIVALIDLGVKEHDEFDNNMRFDLGFNACFEFDHADGGSADNVTPIRTNDYKGHGHKMAGIIGADYGDGGVNGICQNVSIMPILAEGRNEVYQWALTYAVISDVDVIHFSWNIVTDTAFDVIKNVDILVVLPAGNDSSELISSVEDIHANLPNCIVVGNCTTNDQKYYQSNYSATLVDLFAPGYGVNTVGFDTDTVVGKGTCSAAAMVSATAALIMSEATHLSAIEVKELILDNVDVVSALENYCVTGGRLAIDKVVNALYTENRGAHSKGDLNGDGYIDVIDYSLVQMYVSNTMTPSAIQRNAADINGDGALTSADTIRIRDFYQKNSYFPPV